MPVPKEANGDLTSMRRSDLQRLAKQHGIKANMKNDDIIAALEAILQDGSKPESENVKLVNISSNTTDDEDAVKLPAKKSSDKRKRGRPKKRTPKAKDSPSILSSADESTPSGEKFDLFSAKPLWDSSSNLIQLDSTPELDSSGSQGGRTRSSSRNRTPQAAPAIKKPVAAKTFSVDKVRTETKVPTLTAVESAAAKRQTATKRRSTSAGDVIQSKRSRRSTSADKTKDEPIDEKLREEIMEEIRKKREANGGLSASKPYSSLIPRFTAKGVTVGASKPVTPGSKDWGKLHNKQFERLESIDDYERRKKKRAERLLGSNQKNSAAMSRLAQPVKRAGPSIVKPVSGKGRPKPTFMSPAAQKSVGFRSPFTGQKSQLSSAKINDRQKTPKAANSSVFKPTVTSVSKMNLNFVSKPSKLATPRTVAAVKTAEKKEPKVKTLAPAAKNTPAKHAIGCDSRKSVVTPFAVNSSVNTPSSARKNAFDLKASLKKPMSWVPHKGPLKPFHDTAKKPTFKDRMNNAKKPAVAAKEKRKQKIAAEKKQARDKRALSRRGIK